MVCSMKGCSEPEDYKHVNGLMNMRLVANPEILTPNCFLLRPTREAGEVMGQFYSGHTHREAASILKAVFYTNFYYAELN